MAIVNATIKLKKLSLSWTDLVCVRVLFLSLKWTAQGLRVSPHCDETRAIAARVMELSRLYRIKNHFLECKFTSQMVMIGHQLRLYFVGSLRFPQFSKVFEIDVLHMDIPPSMEPRKHTTSVSRHFVVDS